MNYPESSRHQQEARFQSLLTDGRDMVLVFLSAQLNELFNNTDEALLDFAEHAESNEMQNRFFEAMGAVRGHRADMEHVFREQVQGGFETFGESSPRPVEEDQEPEEMSLIEQDDMDEAVAVENLIMKGHDTYFAQLYALGQRFAVLNNGRKISEEQIPGGPTYLVNGFQAAIRLLSVDVKAKIVLYALFDKFVMRQLKGLYDEINSNLKNAGILPNLKPVFSRSAAGEPNAQLGSESQAEVPADGGEAGAAMAQDAGAPTHAYQGGAEAQNSWGSAPNAAAAHQSGYAGGEAQGDWGAAANTEGTFQPSLGEELFDTILHLMASVQRSRPHGSHSGSGQRPVMVPQAGYNTSAPRAAGHGHGHGHDGMMPHGGGAGGGGTGGGRGQLISAIEHVRPAGVGQGQGVLSDLESLPTVAVDPNFVDSLKAVIKSERQQIYAQVDDEQLEAIDADTIELIGMLFEYMLNDPLLPNVAKALLSHLHTPYLKLSLTDRNLLVDSEHPARLLLDLLVEAGGQWVYETDIKRGIFPQMQITVDRVLKESGQNEGLFPELLDYFKAATDEYRRKSDSIEQRAQESLKGREKLHVAKKRAIDEIQNRIRRANLPVHAERFLTQAWTDRLVFILLRRKGDDVGEEWSQSLQTVDDLVWLFGPDAARTDPREIEDVGANIREEIENALDTLGGYHQRYLNELLELLSNPSAIAEWHKQADQASPSEASSEDVLEESQRDVAARASERSAKMPDTAWKKNASAGQPELRDESLASDADSMSQAEQEMLEKMHKIKFGTWFEFEETEGAVRRLKLSWLSPLTSTCMFVDRNGAQAETKTLEDTARLMVSGKIKIVSQPRRPFMERAMLAVKNALQRSLESTD